MQNTWCFHSFSLFHAFLLLSVFAFTSLFLIIKNKDYDLPFLPRHSNSNNKWDVTLDSEYLTWAELVEYLMWTNHSSCQLYHDIGGHVKDNPSAIDGQKAVCIDREVVPKPNQCLVYSFGIGSDWSFDEQMERYGCESFAFNPFIGMDPHNHTPGIHFYNWGLGGLEEISSKQLTIRSLSSIYNSLTVRHGNITIDYLKIDIEHSEWSALPEIFNSGMLFKVPQLGLEIHLEGFQKSINENRERAKLLRLMEKMGMVRFDSKYNPWNMVNFSNSPVPLPIAFEINGLTVTFCNSAVDILEMLWMLVTVKTDMHVNMNQ